jgi:leucine dehydrogenase
MVYVSEDGPQQVHIVRDAASGLDGVVVIHSTTLGPAAGGCRLWCYEDHAAMVDDACRLARGMSYKNALAGLPLGGGKAVLRLPRGIQRRRAMFEAFGRAVRDLQGQYITAEDVGTNVEDMSIVAEETRFVAGLPSQPGKPGGDPSPWTARGVFLSMEHAVRRRLGRKLSDCTVAIQGVGHVGASLALALHKAGARLLVADVDGVATARLATSLGAQVVSTDEIFSADADVFAPCALGGVLNARTIARLTASVVCGAANNQLEEAMDSVRLLDKGILYAPDFVVNAGGIINVAAEYHRWSAEEAARRVDDTPHRLEAVLDLAESQGLTPPDAAERLACQTMADSRARPRAAA